MRKINDYTFQFARLGISRLCTFVFSYAIQGTVCQKPLILPPPHIYSPLLPFSNRICWFLVEYKISNKREYIITQLIANRISENKNSWTLLVIYLRKKYIALHKLLPLGQLSSSKISGRHSDTEMEPTYWE